MTAGDLGFSDLVRSAFEPTPALPDIVTFASHPSFVGDGGPGLFPRQETILRLIFCDLEHLTPYDQDVIEGWRDGFHLAAERWGVPYDIWDRIDWLRARGRRHFSHVIFIGGRRASKGYLGALMVAYEWYRLLLLEDPQAHYGLVKGKHLSTQIMATNYEQARDNMFADLFTLVTSAACFQGRIETANKKHLTLLTPADERRFASQRRAHAARREFASLRARAISSTVSGSRGATNTFIALDEFAHHPEAMSGKPKAEEVYRALAPTVDQMGGDGLIYIPTSPWTDESYAHKLYLDGIEVDEAGVPTNPDFLVLQLPSWAPYEDWDDPAATRGRVFVSAPQRLDADLLRVKRRNPISFKVEYEAQWGSVEGSYLSPDVVDRIFEPFCPACGETLREGGECQECGEAPRTLRPVLGGNLVFGYRAHADAGESESNFAIAIAHSEMMGTEDGDQLAHVIIDYMNVWKPDDYDDHQIPYSEIEREIVELLRGFPSLRVLTLDQYGAFATVSRLREELHRIRHGARVREENFNARSNQMRAERFKAGAGEGWIHAYPDDLGPNGISLLRGELKSLRLKGTRLEKPNTGPIRTKDLADCVMVVAAELITDKLQRQPRRERLGNTPLLYGPGYRSRSDGSLTVDTEGARGRLNELARERIRNPYGRWVPSG